MAIRITGLNSGLDTESIISALVSSYNYKTNKYRKAQTKLSWKQDAWKSLNTKIYSLYTSVGNYRFSSAYNLKSATSSDSTKVSVSASSSAVNGSYSVQVTSLAKAGYLTGAKLGSSTTTSTTLAELGYTGGDGSITLTMGDGTTKSISVSQGTTVNSFINSLKDAGVSANYDEANKRIYVSSKSTGADNDFTLTGANVDGASALTKLGLNVSSDATTATYTSYTQYITGGDASSSAISANVIAAVNDYNAAKEAYDTASAQNSNLSAAYSYATAYSAMQEVLESTGLSSDEQENLVKLLSMTATERVNSVMDADGNVYTKSATDEDGNTVYAYTDADGNKSYITGVVSYTDGTNTYTLNDDKTYTDELGNVYTKTTEKDADGNYYYATADGSSKVVITSETTYYATTATEEGAGTDDAKMVYSKGAEISGASKASDVLTSLKEASGLTSEQITKLTSNISTVHTYETTKDSLDDSDAYSRASIMASVKDAYENGYAGASGADAVTALTNTYASVMSANTTAMETAETTMEKYSNVSGLDVTDADAMDAFVAQVQAANDILSSTDYNTDAKKIDGQDATIYVNGIKYTGTSNAFTINGLTITANAITSETYDATEATAITATVNTDTQGIYDKIKDFLTQYNALINEMNSLYNAESAKGYEPLTDEEKDAMSDTEIEKWEEKIKASLLRRDDTLQSLISSMTSAMSKAVEINGKNYYLSSFGIQTLGYLNAAENEEYAYHIDGDEDDAATSGNTDKLMAAITNDPDTLVEFMQGLASNLYEAVDKKMKSTTLSSVYTVYNDKEMASEYSDYTDLISKWEDKLTAKEDYYYSKFSAMETALAKLNASSSSLSGLLGS
ncbi:MAG: flagellar filament capping protein FliD [Roseburia sp.]